MKSFNKTRELDVMEIVIIEEGLKKLRDDFPNSGLSINGLDILENLIEDLKRTHTIKLKPSILNK
jgi:hypothetical protein